MPPLTVFFYCDLVLERVFFLELSFSRGIADFDPSIGFFLIRGGDLTTLFSRLAISKSSSDES